MVGQTVERGSLAAGAEVASYRSAAPALRVAQTWIGVAVVVAALDGVASLVAAAVSGWALTFDPRGTAAAGTRHVSAGVVELLVTVSSVAALAWVVLVMAMVAAGVSLIRWQRVAVANLAALGPGRPRWSPRAAALSWFVPVRSLYAPRDVLHELWSSGATRARDPAGAPGAGAPRFLTLGWGLWVSAQLLTVLAVLQSVRSPTLAEMGGSHLTQLGVDLALVAAGMLLLHAITETTTHQDTRHASRSAAHEPG